MAKDQLPPSHTQSTDAGKQPGRRQSLYGGTNQLGSTRGAALSLYGLSKPSTKVSKYVSRVDMPADMMERLIWRRKNPDGSLEPVDFDDVIMAAKFGIFQITLMIVSGLIFGSFSCSASSLSFVIPAAGCDLGIGVNEKGIIESAPLGGMIVGIFIWGPLSDSKGRKPTLQVCLLLDAIASILSAFSIHKWMFLSFRIINGFGIIGACSLIFAYFGEFLDENKRDALLTSMEIFWILGLCYVPCVAWLILPTNINYKVTDNFHFKSWNLLCISLGALSLISFILLFFVPESPRFLMTAGKLEKAHLVVKKMYTTNTRKPAETFPIVVLDQAPAAHLYFETDSKLTFWEILQFYCSNILSNMKELFSTRQDSMKMLQTCAIDFCGSFGYITLVLWLPIIVHKWEEYVTVTGKDSAQLCVAAVSNMTADNEHSFCNAIPSDVYISTLTVAVSTTPAVALLLVAVVYINKKLILFLMLNFAAGSALCIYFFETKTTLLAGYILFESFSSMIESVVFMIAIVIFAVNIRGTAIALTVVCARSGAILGTILMGNLLETNCQIPIAMFAGSFWLAAVITLTLPKIPQGYCRF